MKKLAVAALISTALVFTGCGQKEEVKNVETVEKQVEVNIEEVQEEVQTEETQDAIETPEVEEKEFTPEEYKEMGVNELGQVMVMMYHSLGEKNEAYVRTPEDFRKDIQTMYDNGYRLVSLVDYVNNNIDIPAGYSPIVLTFDDGHITNFNVIEENGEIKIDPNCVVGILEDFNKEHPDFGLEATFFLNGGHPFKQKEYVEYKLKHIVDMGMDLGNHSYNHDNFKEISSEKLQTTLGRIVEMIDGYVPGYEVNTLALPFGISPKNENVKKYVYGGTYNDKEYENIAVLKVGWKPEVSAAHKKFNYKAINRVQSGDGEYQFAYWFKDLENNPSKKYISDGNPNTIVVPEKYQENIKDSMKEKFEIITY